MRGLETGDELMHGGGRGQHAHLSGGNRTWRGQPFLLIDRRECRDASGPLTGAIRRSPGSARGWPAAATFTGGPPPEPGEFLLCDTRDRIAIGFAGPEHMPGESHELAGSGDDGDVPIFAALEFADEGAKRARVTV